jgi:hypothetical protein
MHAIEAWNEVLTNQRRGYVGLERYTAELVTRVAYHGCRFTGSDNTIPLTPRM